MKNNYISKMKFSEESNALSFFLISLLSGLRADSSALKAVSMWGAVSRPLEGDEKSPLRYVARKRGSVYTDFR